jgi:LmbE family N-acetylglucosaminyl deacetylase
MSVGSSSRPRLAGFGAEPEEQDACRRRRPDNVGTSLASCDSISHPPPFRTRQRCMKAFGLLTIACSVLLATGCGGGRPCETARGAASNAAARGLRRAAESVAAMAVLGLRWSDDPRRSDVLLLGYPDLGLTQIASADSPWNDDPSGLHHTYAEDFDGIGATCNGDLRYLLEGRHAELTARMLAADLDAVLDLTRPSDVYTHVGFDGHPDHAEVSRQVAAALARSRRDAVLHTTLIHPQGTGGCLALSAGQWPNPSPGADAPFARFTPALDVTPPPLPPCAVPSDRANGERANAEGASWGPLGPPDELVEVPPDMQTAEPDRNLKWLAIARYASQVDCTRRDDGSYPASCGYMRAFVKRHEFFWTHDFGDAATRDPGGPVLVVAAHPDDEALGAAGVIVRARAAGRRVYAVVVTNGEGRR